ncbi:hypothetical protein [Terracidiphilus sp.]|jgi:gamma-glutamyl:cysteine ligase YbdK (ATP-grasp superfamily)|uniref:hypothetical protein n=1 Tax=Terracidiphilus sp. TaxID=1964191 RepID=UPI003C1F64B8
MTIPNSSVSGEYSVQQRYSMVEDLHSDINESSVEFLLMDLDLALAFMDATSLAGDQETIHRNHENARAAFDNVKRLLQRLKPSAAQRSIIENKLAILKLRLLAVGQRF